MSRMGEVRSDAPGWIGATLSGFYGCLGEANEIRRGLDILRSAFDVDLLAMGCRSVESYTQISSHIISCATPQQSNERSYIERYCAKDPFVNLPIDQPLTIQSFMEERSWQSHEFMQEFLEPMNVYHVMGADIKVGSTQIFTLRLARRPDAKDFTSEDVDVVREFLPHLRQFLRLQAKLNQARTLELAMDAVTEGMQVGAVVLDGQAKVVHSAGLAKARLSQRQGFDLWSGRLRATYPANDRKLQSMLQHVQSVDPRPCSPQAARFEQAGKDGPLGVSLRRLPEDRDQAERSLPGAIIVFQDLDRDTEISEETLKQLFALTAAEARLARLLAKGLSIDEAAERLSVSRNTLRTHLAALFQKTGTFRQAELVRTLVSNGTMFG